MDDQHSKKAQMPNPDFIEISDASPSGVDYPRTTPTTQMSNIDENHLPPAWANQMTSLTNAVVDKRLSNARVISSKETIKGNHFIPFQPLIEKEKVISLEENFPFTLCLPSKSRKKI